MRTNRKQQWPEQHPPVDKGCDNDIGHNTCRGLDQQNGVPGQLARRNGERSQRRAEQYEAREDQEINKGQSHGDVSREMRTVQEYFCPIGAVA